MSIADKLTTIADNEPKVYKAGQIALLKDSKYMNAIKSGSIITANDVSPIEHDLKVKLSSDTITDFSNVNVTRCGKNILPYPYTDTTKTVNGITFTDNGDGTITANGTATAIADYVLVWYFPIKKGCLISGAPIGSANDTFEIQCYTDATNNFATAGSTNASKNDFTITVTRIRIRSGYTANNLVFKPQLEYNTVATEYEPYITPKTVTANADGTVEGLTSLSPNMTLLTDTDGVSINCQYYRDIDLYIDNLITDIALTGGE